MEKPSPAGYGRLRLGIFSRLFQQISDRKAGHRGATSAFRCFAERRGRYVIGRATIHSRRDGVAGPPGPDGADVRQIADAKLPNAPLGGDGCGVRTP